MASSVWVEAAMLPFLLLLGLALSSRFATKAEVNERFLALAWAALAATAMDVVVRIVPTLAPENYFVAEVEHHFAVIVCGYCLLRYVAAYVQQSENPFVKFNFLLLCVSSLLLFLHLAGWGRLAGPLYQVLSFGPGALFALEAFCLQLIYQKYYGNGQFIVMNLLFLLLIDAFVIQYVLRQDFPVIFVVATILLFITFFYLQAPAYRQIVEAGEQTEKERIIAEFSIQQTNKANRAKSDFLANTSHEIRTPMNAILGMNEMILKEAVNDPETRDASFDIQRAGNHLLNIINNILDISKIESGKMELFAEDYHLWKSIKDWEDFTHKRIQAKIQEREKREHKLEEKIALQFNIDVDKTLPDFLHGDSVRLSQILTNLLSNAVKYTREGSITLAIRGEMETKARVKLRFYVSDTGIGISKEALPRLFEPFERMNLLETRDVLGAGLGMPLVKHLVKLMSGEITVTSEYGVGTTVMVDIPQYVATGPTAKENTIAAYEEEYEREKQRKEREAREAAEAEENSGPFTCPDAHILVVDDTPVNLVVAKGMLGSTEARIDTAESGEDALKMMEKTHYDVVFLDHKMPGMDGVETLTRARGLGQMTEGTMYVALTANADARAQYIGLGFDDYLPKPFKSEAMMEILRRFLKKPRA